MYLPTVQVYALLRRIGRVSHPQSVLMADTVNRAHVHSLIAYYRLFRWGVDRKDLAKHLSVNGWRLQYCGELRNDRDDDDSDDEETPVINYGRYTAPPPIDDTTHPHKPPRSLRTFMVVASFLKARHHVSTRIHI